MARGLLAAALCACGDPRPQPARVSLLVEARSSAGEHEPIAGLLVWADGRALGASDAQGRLHAQLEGRAGQAVVLRFACPPAYRTRLPERRLVLGRVETRATKLELTEECEPLQHTVVVVARAQGPGVAGLPILAGATPVGQLERDGTAHVVLELPARQSLRVQIDTRSRPELVPQNPVHTFQLEDDDGLVLVDQHFGVARPKQPVRHLERRPYSDPKLPYRIERR